MPVPLLAEDLAPRLAGTGVALEFCERLVKHLPFGQGRRTAIQQVCLVEFGEPCEELGTVADGQPGQFFKDLSCSWRESSAVGIFLQASRHRGNDEGRSLCC
jgi:hypothetical protein